jgi:hypothetical protein
MKAPIDHVDFGKTASDYLMHRAGFPDSVFVRLKEAGVGTKNENVVNLGTGTGSLGRGFARKVVRSPVLILQWRCLELPANWMQPRDLTQLML